MSKLIMSLNKNSHINIFKNTIVEKKFKIVPGSDIFLWLHTPWELAKHSQETQNDLMNLGELRGEICLAKQVLEIQK